MHKTAQGSATGKETGQRGRGWVVSLRWYATEQKSQKGASHGENGGRLLQVKGAASTRNEFDV